MLRWIGEDGHDTLLCPYTGHIVKLYVTHMVTLVSSRIAVDFQRNFLGKSFDLLLYYQGPYIQLLIMSITGTVIVWFLVP